MSKAARTWHWMRQLDGKWVPQAVSRLRVVGSTRRWGPLGRGPQLMIRVSRTGAVLVSAWVYAIGVLLGVPVVALWQEAEGGDPWPAVVAWLIGAPFMGAFFEAFGRARVEQDRRKSSTNHPRP